MSACDPRTTALVLIDGVESTCRYAWELGYDAVVVEDACAGPSAELHEMAIRSIFPRIARVVTADRIVLDP